MIAKGYSINLYMAHGGTTFGWMNGANSDNDGYQPDVSSYDYDAPLDESGRPRPKYFALRDLIRDVSHREPPPVPDSAAMMTLPAVRLTQSEPLLLNLPKGIRSDMPLSMEDVVRASDAVYQFACQRMEGQLICGYLHNVPAFAASLWHSQTCRSGLSTDEIGIGVLARLGIRRVPGCFDS